MRKTIWEKGDFTRIAASMRESGEALVATLGLKPGLKILDLGSGDGTTALPAARLGAEVIGVDTARNLVEAISCLITRRPTSPVELEKERT